MATAAADRAVEARRTAVLAHQRSWLWAALAACGGSIALLAWRLLRARSPVAAIVETPVVDAGTAALWAAAQALGDAQRAEAQLVAARQARVAADEGVRASEAQAFDLDGPVVSDLPSASQVAAAATPGPAPVVPPVRAESTYVLPSRPRTDAAELRRPEPTRVPAAAPEVVRVRLFAPRPSAASAIERQLAAEPRVLQKPRPVVRTEGAFVVVELVLVPGLPAADQALVRSALQQAAALG